MTSNPAQALFFCYPTHSTTGNCLLPRGGKRLGRGRASQSDGRGIIKNGRLAHELAHFAENGRAEFLRGLPAGVLKLVFHLLQSELFGFTPGLNQSS